MFGLSSFFLNPHSFPLIQSAILIMIIGTLVRRQSPRQESSWFFFLICCTVSVWFIGSTLMYSCRDAQIALRIYRSITFLGVAHIVTFVYQFSVSWLNYRGWRKKLGPVSLWIGTGFYLASVFMPQAYDGVRMHSWGYGPQYGIVLKIFLIYFFFFFFLAFHNFIVAYFHSKLPTHRKQIRLMLLAFLISFISSTEYIPKISHIEIYPIGCIATFAWIVMVAYGLMRYQLFSIHDITRIAQDMRLATLGVMSASLSHEVKNPVYAMKGRAEAGLEKLHDQENLSLDEARQICDAVVKQSDRILDIVRHFSQFARNGMDSKLKMESFDLRLILESIQPFVQHQITQGKVDLKVLFPPDMPNVKVDSRRMEEVFINLILNACQAMEGKVSKPAIEIGAEVFDKEIKITVQDNGPSLSADQKEKIFEPFYTTKPGGMGLGLFISKQLIEEMGGRIVIELSPGKGANFLLFLRRESPKS